ncbi:MULTISPECIES: YkyA family protein [unclassified Bacillus (in: firmicutes)]|uniref:YkyA family protein n=1 Tax=unclassified Bacillus (in: firmicutes) TaxID=185979 RepID=UPI0015CEFA3C|nr:MULTISPECIES: YkyA family protein [unclassified Bacillus (in: firmicutes)]
MYKKIYSLFLIVSLLLIFCMGCTSQANQRKLVINKLSEIAKMEQKFQKAGEKIQKLEIKELEYYEKIYLYKINEVNKRQESAKLAINLLNERKEGVKEESKLIHDIDIKIEELQTINIETKDEKFRNEVNNFIKTWRDRTNLYDKLNSKYKEAIETDLSIYQLLSQKKVDLKNVKSKTKNTNKNYKDVIKYNDQLNLYTQKLNDLQKDIYEKYGK